MTYKECVTEFNLTWVKWRDDRQNGVLIDKLQEIYNKSPSCYKSVISSSPLSMLPSSFKHDNNIIMALL